VDRPDATSSRPTPGVGRFARLGFDDADAAAAAVRQLPEHVVEAAAAGADPDQALRGLIALVAAAPDGDDLLAALSAHAPLTVRLVAVLGASRALADHLVRHPDHWHDLAGTDLLAPVSATQLRAELLRAVGADPLTDRPGADLPAAGGGSADPTDALRIAYRRQLLRIAARDLAENADLVAVGAELADLAGAALEAALAVARTEVGGPPIRLAVVAMGKTGARELNYVSDVDVVYVAEPLGDLDDESAQRIGARLAAALARVCSAATAEGSLWEVDAGLRPEGRSGPLTRSLASHVAY
jgi:glutamate-ammonia-ligase adenylyltransferase